MSESRINTDTHLFFEDDEDMGYSPSCHMTVNKSLGIQVGGTVYVRDLRTWHSYSRVLEEFAVEMHDILDNYIEQEVRGEGRGFFEVVKEQLAKDKKRIDKMKNLFDPNDFLGL